MNSPFRIGLILDSLCVSSWIAEIITQLLRIPDVQINLVILPTEFHTEATRHSQSGSSNRLFDWYMQCETRRVAGSLRHLGTVDLAELLTEAPRLYVQPVAKTYTDVVREEDVSLIRNFHLDLLIRFGFRIIRGSILGAARYGVWSYHHGDNDKFRGGPPGFWEIFDREAISGVTLQVLTNDLDGGLIVGKSFIRTHDTSPVCNRENLYWSGISLMRDAVAQVASLKPDPTAFFQSCAASSMTYTRGILKKPTNEQTIAFLGRQGVRYAKERISCRRSVEQWSVGICKGSLDDVVRSEMLESSWYLPKPEHFVADPFPVSRDGSLFIFVEEFLYRDRKGKISVLAYDTKSGFSDPHPVLEAAHHLSYPYVFESGGTLFMVPESEQDRRVVLYECTEFPHKWRERSILLEDFPGIDSSLVFHDGLWWLFTTDGSYNNSDNNLHLFFSEQLDGPYRRHPFGRIKSSLFGARMAGRIVERDGRLLRPGQNCVMRYGGSLVLHEITELSPERYAERTIAEIQNGITGEFRDAFHTINQCGNYTVIDGSRRIKR